MIISPDKAWLYAVVLWLPSVFVMSQSEPVASKVLGAGQAGLGDQLTVEVHPLKPLLDKANCAGIPSGCVKQNVALFINGMPLRNLQPVVDTYAQTLTYNLTRTDSTKDVWSALLGAPQGTTRSVKVSVGLENEHPIETQIDSFQLVVLRPYPSIFAAILVLAMLLFFFVLAKQSSIIRDPGPANPGTAIPYSLARSQMAFWFFLVITAFLFIWLTTGQHDTLPAQVLTLIGIGTGTALGAALIDSGKKAQTSADLSSLSAEKATLDSRVAELKTALQSNPPNSNELQVDLTAKLQRLTAVNGELGAAKASLEPLESKGFLVDILSDANGITFHRFQLMVWTLVLGIVFCASVYKSLAMPQFNETLLALMGITSGTYIGFKFPEQH